MAKKHCMGQHKGTGVAWLMCVLMGYLGGYGGSAHIRDVRTAEGQIDGREARWIYLTADNVPLKITIEHQ